jgi:hypothetical protein
MKEEEGWMAVNALCPRQEEPLGRPRSSSVVDSDRGASATAAGLFAARAGVLFTALIGLAITFTFFVFVHISSSGESILSARNLKRLAT